MTLKVLEKGRERAFGAALNSFDSPLNGGDLFMSTFEGSSLSLFQTLT